MPDKTMTAVVKLVDEVSGNAKKIGSSSSSLGKHFESLKKNWIGISATIFGTYKALQGAWDLAKGRAEFDQSQRAFKSMAESMGVDAKKVMDNLKTMSGNLIDDKSLQMSANKAISLGIPIEKLGDLMLVARAKARDMGLTTTQAFNDIATGVGRGSPLILDNLGLVMKTGSANEALAKKLGKTVEQLTDKERKQAILNATLEAGQEAIERNDFSMRTNIETMEALSVTTENLKLRLGEGLLPITGALAVGIGETLVGAVWVLEKAFQGLNVLFNAVATALLAGIEVIARGYEKIMGLISFSEVAKENHKNLKAMVNDLSAWRKSFQIGVVESTDKFLGAEKDKTNASNKTNKALKKNTVDEKTEDLKAIKEKKKWWSDHYEMLLDLKMKASKHDAKAREEEEKETKESNKNHIQFVKDRYNKLKQLLSDYLDTNETIQTQINTNAWAMMEERVRIANDEHARQQEILELDYQNRLDAQKENVYLYNQTYLKKQQIDKSYQEWFLQGMLVQSSAWGSMGAQIAEIGETAVTSLTNSLSTGLFDLITTGTADAQSLFKGLMRSMLGAITNFMAQTIVQDFMKYIISGGVGAGVAGGVAGGATQGAGDVAKQGAIQGGAFATTVALFKGLAVWLVGIFTSPVTLIVLAIVGLVLLIKNNIKLIGRFFKDIFNSIAQFQTNMIKAIIKIPQIVGKFLGDIFGSVGDFFNDIFASVADFNLSEFMQDLYSSISDFFKKIFDWFANFSFAEFFNNIFNSVSQFFSNIGQAISDFFSKIFNWFTNFSFASFFADIFESVKAFFSKPVKWLKDFSFASFFQNIFESVRTFFNKPVEWLRDFSFATFFTNIGNSISNLFTKVGELLDKASDLIKNIINQIVDITVPGGSKGGFWTGIKNFVNDTANILNPFKWSFANGTDFVNAPIGKAVPAIVHGGEKIIQYGRKGNNGQESGKNINVTINMQSVSIRDERDISLLAEEIKRLLNYDDLKSNFGIVI